MTPVPTIGRIVGYVLPEGHSRAGQVVPAIVTRTSGGESINLTPFVDVANDEPVDPSECCSVMPGRGATPPPRSWYWLPLV